MDSTSLFSQAIVNTSLGFCVVNQEGIIILSNDAFNHIADCEKTVGHSISDIIALKKDDILNLIKEVIQRETMTKEVVFTCQEEPFYALANASVVVCGTQMNEKMVAIFFTEVNKQKDLESKLEERIKEEIEKNRQKEQMMHQQAKLATMGEMIGNIAHQWRQPLNILALILQDIYIKFQLSSLDTQTLEKNYDKANNLLQYMSQTIDDFRTFFKNEEDDKPFDVAEALSSVFDLIGTRFSENHTHCETIIHDHVKVKGTQNGFKQVVINLLNNAHEAIGSSKTKEGKINIEVRRQNNQVIISISDNGGGVPQAIMDQIFDPYFTTKHQSQGTGLGLYMSKQIIEHNMGGTLEVRNSKEGAVFTITLPIV